MLVSLLLVPPLRRYATTLKLVDTPDERKVHQSIVPRVGGIAMIGGTLFAILVWLEPGMALYSFLAGVIIIAVFGTWDDRNQLGYRIKFLGQFIASLLVILVGDVKVNSLPFLYDEVIPDYIAVPFTLFAMLGITNAINLTDGLDGLAGGSSLLSLGVIALLGLVAGDINFVLLCMAIMGAILGFLRFNTHPASIFMGDTGSQFLGFSLGVLVIWLTQNIYPVISPSIAIIILGLPVLDTLYVMSQRLFEGRSPFRPDKRHIHHKLLSAGLDHYEAVSCIYLVQSTMVLCAYIFRFQNDFMILGIYLLSGLFFLYLIEILNRHAIINRNRDRYSLFRRLMEQGDNRSQLIRFCAATGSTSLLVYFAIIIMEVETIPAEVMLISAVLLIAGGLITMVTKGIGGIGWLRLELYLTCTLMVYLCHINPPFDIVVMRAVNLLYAAFLVITFLGLVLPERGKQNITPLDYLIIFVMVVLYGLPENRFADVGHYSVDIIRLFLLFYLCEFILMSVKKNVIILKGGILSALALILLKYSL